MYGINTWEHVRRSSGEPSRTVLIVGPVELVRP